MTALVERHSRRRLRAAALALALAAGGCAGGNTLGGDMALLGTSSAGLSPAAAVLLEQAQHSARTRLTGAGLGAGLGAGAGLAAAFLGGGVTQNTGARLALIGGAAAAGTALGYAAGSYVDTRNRQAAGRQAELGSLIAAAGQEAERYGQARQLAEAAAAESGQEVARLNREHAAGRANAAAYRAQARSLDASLLSTRRMAQDLGATLGVMEQDIAQAQLRGQDTAGLEERRDALRAEHAGLLASYQAMLGTVDRMPGEARSMVAEARQ